MAPAQRMDDAQGYSPVADSAGLISEAWLCDAKLATASWYARVPTSSNMVDKTVGLGEKTRWRVS